jgi:hypothetical protein
MTKSMAMRLAVLGLMGSLVLAPVAMAETTPPVATASLPVPAADALLMMIRSNALALGQANATGNYEVLRAIGSAKFRALNTPEALAKTFAAVRELHLDVSPVVVTTPVLTDPPAITPEGLLRVYGAFPTTPVEVPFGMLFEVEGGAWKLNAISMGARPAAKVAEAVMPLADPPKEKPKAESKTEKKGADKKK